MSPVVTLSNAVRSLAQMFSVVTAMSQNGITQDECKIKQSEKIIDNLALAFGRPLS